MKGLWPGLSAALAFLASVLSASLPLAPHAAFAADQPGAALSVPDATIPTGVVDVRVGPLDKLKVTVFGVESLSQEYQVDQNGRLKLPLIGEVDVKGYTPSELAMVLEQKFGEKYLQNADVTVLVVESAGAQLTVDGNVKKPGIYPVKGHMSLLQAVALAGGADETANPKQVMIFRMIDGKRQAGVFDLTKIRKGRAEDPQVFGNDIIVMDGSSTSNTYRSILRSVPLATLFFF